MTLMIFAGGTSFRYSFSEITFQRINVRETNCAIQWIVIYTVDTDSAIHLLNKFMAPAELHVMKPRLNTITLH